MGGQPASVPGVEECGFGGDAGRECQSLTAVPGVARVDLHPKGSTGNLGTHGNFVISSIFRLSAVACTQQARVNERSQLP